MVSRLRIHREIKRCNFFNLAPAFDVGFAPKRCGLGGLGLLVNDAYGRVAPRIRAALAGLVVIQSFLNIFGNTGVKAATLAMENVDKPHWAYYSG